MLTPRGGWWCALAGLAAGACGGAPSPVADPTAPSPVAETASPDRGPTEAVAVAAGDFHSCAVMVGGSVSCWGRNRDGELGDGGASGNQSRPTAVPGLREVEEVASGHGFSCARAKGGVVRCWGTGRILGDERAVERQRPTEVESARGAVELRAGGLIACARLSTGAVRCWGTPAIPIGAPTAGADDVAVSGAHACSRTLDRKVTCWGEGLWFGKGAVQARSIDVAKSSALSTGDNFACVLIDGAPRCFGRNAQGELGLKPDGDVRTKLTPLKSITDLVSLSSAEAHTCALTKSESLLCWGSNNEGELGRGKRSASELPAPIELAHVTQVSVGAGHVCARTSDSKVWCWGANGHGQLGDGSTERRLTPVRVAF